MANPIDEPTLPNIVVRFLDPGRRPEKNPDIAALASVELFQGLSRRDLKRLVSIAHRRAFAPDEALFEHGQPGAAMFVIKRGRVAVTVPDRSGHDVEVATLLGGAFVGELALLDASPRSAAAVAREPTETLAFFREDLNRLLDTAPRLSSKIYRALALCIGQRLKAMNAQLLEQQAQQGTTTISVQDHGVMA